MCTVTYIPPSKDFDFVLTSNRDEKEFRPTVPPEIYKLDGIDVVFPKDEKAGGSWIAANGNGRLCCLLNGAYVPHEKQDFHTKSRGKILAELASSQNTVEDFFKEKDLNNVEPFTIVTIDQDAGIINKFNEFVWDGEKKYFRELDKNKPYIWSSVTLYSEEQRELRKEWFSKFFMEYKNHISPGNVYSFHSGSYTNDQSIDVVMQREGGLKTVSITQVAPGKNKLFMKYFDLLHHSNHECEI